MTIVLTGGGSGGHITPILAVAHELKQQAPEAKLIYVGEKGGVLQDAVIKSSDIDRVLTIRAGKFRRYHNQGWKAIVDIPTIAKNIRDFFFMLVGIVQAWKLLGKTQPDLVFMKGGYVGLPMGLAARLRHIPVVTHDSDAVPGLANRIGGKRAITHAVGMPKDMYTYDPDHTIYTGVPVHSNYQHVTPSLQKQYRRELNLHDDDLVLFVTGGGRGAQRLNDAIVRVAPELFEQFPNLVILHATGEEHADSIQHKYDEMLNNSQRDHVIVRGFIADAYKYSGAADLIVSRAGATVIAEFAVQGKACLLVPNPMLTGGHQLKNAAAIEKTGAVRIIDESLLQPKHQKDLSSAIVKLLDSPERRQELANKLSKHARPSAAAHLAELLVANGSRKA